MTTTYRHLLSLLSALLLIMLCGCGSDDGSREAYDDDTISFMAASDDDLATRGTVTRGDFDTQKQFRAYAWDANGNGIVYMLRNYDGSNVVSYNSTLNVWSTTEKYYWPADDNAVLDFYVFHPVDAPFDSLSRQIRYAATSVIGDTDLLYGKCASSKKTANYVLLTNTYSAEINFRHALSKVDFQANIVTPGVAVTIRSLELCNVYGKGTFTFPSGVTNTNNESTDYGSWSSQNTTATYRYRLGSADPITLTAEATALGTSDYPIQLVPQTREAWNPNTTPTTTIEANDALATPGTYLKIGCSIVKDGVECADDGYVYCPLTVDWQPAKQYTYTLSFGGGYDHDGKTILTPVTITAAIEPWTTVTGTLETD